jgi:hypothetical protein
MEAGHGVQGEARGDAEKIDARVLRSDRTYEKDFVAWTEETARLIRAGRMAEVDLEHVAEEIEDIGRRDSREVWSRLRVLITYLLKWSFQPRKRTRSSRSTIATQRSEIHDIFEQSPSVRGRVPARLARIYREAMRAAAIETGLSEKSFPRDCPFRIAQVLDRDFLPH